MKKVFGLLGILGLICSFSCFADDTKNNLEWKWTTDNGDTIRCIYLSMNGNDVGSIDIDWGDGSAPESALVTSEGQVSIICHEYTSQQNYSVTMEGTTTGDDFNYVGFVDQHVTEITAGKSDTLDYFVIEETVNPLPESSYNNMISNISGNHGTIENIIPEPATNNSPSSNTGGSNGGGGDGGGGGEGLSYSCKNLPNNATTNNKLTPKSNTDYSYSTDTGAVCTFQCKSGYIRNEKSATCDKSESDNNTGDIIKLDESNTNDTINNNPNKKDIFRYEEGNQSEILSNGFSREFNNAYKFAYEYGITTMDDISKANMNGPLTRIAMAKMLSNYAINILGKKPANKVVPKFPDVDEQLNEDYGGAVDLAYQLGIMGIGTDKFRPYDPVTRKEFGTSLSRMLFGLEDGTDVYYSTHLKKLKTEGIISNYNPELKELRGYVMIMLMRSAM